MLDYREDLDGFWARISRITEEKSIPFLFASPPFPPPTKSNFARDSITVLYTKMERGNTVLPRRELIYHPSSQVPT